MSKEYLEALQRMEYFVNEEMGIKTFEQSGWHIEGTDDYELVKEALQRLEAIDNSKPSEALEKYLKWLERQEFFIEISDGKYVKCIDIIKPALLKAQEQEKLLSILKEKRIGLDLFYSFLKKGLPYEVYFANYSTYGDGILSKEEFDLLKRYLK